MAAGRDNVGGGGGGAAAAAAASGGAGGALGNTGQILTLVGRVISSDFDPKKELAVLQELRNLSFGLSPEFIADIKIKPEDFLKFLNKLQMLFFKCEEKPVPLYRKVVGDMLLNFYLVVDHPIVDGYMSNVDKLMALLGNIGRSKEAIDALSQRLNQFLKPETAKDKLKIASLLQLLFDIAIDPDADANSRRHASSILKSFGESSEAARKMMAHIQVEVVEGDRGADTYEYLREMLRGIISTSPAIPTTLAPPVRISSAVASASGAGGGGGAAAAARTITPIRDLNAEVQSLRISKDDFNFLAGIK